MAAFSPACDNLARNLIASMQMSSPVSQLEVIILAASSSDSSRKPPRPDDIHSMVLPSNSLYLDATCSARKRDGERKRNLLNILAPGLDLSGSSTRFADLSRFVESNSPSQDMKFSDELRASSTLISDEILMQLILSVFVTYEQKDISVVKSFHEDATMRLIGHGIAKGRSSVKELYEWMFSGLTGSSFVVKTVDVGPKETNITFDGEFVFPEGEPVLDSLEMTLNRDPKDAEVKAMVVKGTNLKALLEKVMQNAGPIPPCVILEA
ncbi:hypothetical protein BKA70DRAFT_1565803 [Coprinopsis sp. MPI-PUGE-AT-0042]|nr:hypothetical protein BKA70DRAFT_1565803 [Coprinopsis sp. MPI-PUGE-AT-0042]